MVYATSLPTRSCRSHSRDSYARGYASQRNSMGGMSGGHTSSSRVMDPIRGAERPAMCRMRSLAGLPFSGSSLGRTMMVSPDKTAKSNQVRFVGSGSSKPLQIYIGQLRLHNIAEED